MDTRFAISQYPNAAEINSKLYELIKKPIYTITPEALAAYEKDYFDAKCQKSKAMIDEAKKIIPGGVQHNLAFNYPFPLVFTKAEGCYLYDIAQKIYQRYVDIPKGEGATLAKYRKQSRIRLIIIIVLAVALLVVIFALINTLTRSRDRDTYPMPQRRFRDEDEDISDLKSRMDRSRRQSVRNEDDYRRSRRSSLADEEDMDDGFDMDDESFGSSRNTDERSYRGRQEFTTRYPSGSQQPPQRRGSAPAPRA